MLRREVTSLVYSDLSCCLSSPLNVSSIISRLLVLFFSQDSFVFFQFTAALAGHAVLFKSIHSLLFYEKSNYFMTLGLSWLTAFPHYQYPMSSVALFVYPSVLPLPLPPLLVATPLCFFFVLCF